ncbi:MAG TPA: CGNR zinc finger domain-containing protein, partial [Actinomycetota bacterium]|nr:CGNR zinc finger domain-containing protein [Actinomycetota bacterium]
MDFTHYSDRSVALAVALVNGGDRLDLAGLGRLVRGFQVRPVAADVPAARALAARLRAAFGAAEPAEAVATINAVLAEAGPVPQVSGHGGQPWHLHVVPADAAFTRWLAATTAMALAGVVCHFGAARLGCCAAADCEDAFVDTSRNRSRRYCSDACANRSNVAA